MDISIIVSIDRVEINNKQITTPFNPLFSFILSIVKPFEILPKHSLKSFISEFFV